MTENFGYPCRVHSVNILEDGVRDNHSLSDYELNTNVNKSDFIPTLVSAKWKMDKIIFDNYRMYDQYIEEKFNERVFLNLIKIAELGLLADPNGDYRNRGKIYLPFCRHFFITCSHTD